MNSRRSASLLLTLVCLFAASQPARAFTLQQSLLGEVTPPSVVGTYSYAPDFFLKANGNLAMLFCSGYYYGTCTDGGTGYVNFTGDVIRSSEYSGGAWQPAGSNAAIVLCASNTLPYGCPAGPCPSNFAATDQLHACDPSIVRFSGVFYLYYTAPTTPTSAAGTNNSIYLATSNDGVTFLKHVAADGWVRPAIAYSGDPTSYGLGQSSVLVESVAGTQRLVMYYSYANGACDQWELRRAESTDGVAWSNHKAVLKGCGQTFGAPAVRKISFGQSPIYFLVGGGNHVASAPAVLWSYSQDGIHWMPASSNRSIVQPIGFTAHNAGLTLPTGSTLDVVYGSADASLGPPDPAMWRLRSTQITLQSEQPYGHLDEITSDLRARGWAYDPDAGINDAASSGDPSAALGFGSAIRVVGTNTVTGSVVEGPWQVAELCRPDLPQAGVAPDCYHGFTTSLAFLPTGQWNVRVQAGEFPVGLGAVYVSGEKTVTIPDATAPSIVSISPTNGSTLGGDAITISGTGFAAGAGVLFGGAPSVKRH